MGTEGEVAQPPSLLQRVVIGRNPKVTALRLVIWVALLLLVGNFVILRIRVVGVSMLPTLKENGMHLLNRQAYLFHPPRRGDIVGIKLAGEHLMYLKRIIALPGETVAFHNGHAVINGLVLDEPYVKGPCSWEHEPITVGPDEYYLVGDNRTMDFFDHEQGRADRSRIVGKLLL
jgi:signal peptidase I